MTKEEAIEKINEDLLKENTFLSGEIWFSVTKIESWFNLQTIEQLPEQIKVPKYGASRLVIDHKGIMIHDNFYPWSDICMTGYKKQARSQGRLVIGLNNGDIEEVDGPSEWRMGIDELGHIIEFYKKKYIVNNK